MPDNQAEQRVWAALPAQTREALAALSDSDLRSLLLTVARERAARVTPAELMRRWSSDRFVRPAEVDPRTCNSLEARLWDLLPSQVHGVELAPVAPLGTSSALGPVSQDRVVATMRLTEVVSDCTNALALEAAARRKKQSRAGRVDLAASSRLLRAQVFGAGFAAHFRLFALVSSARDSGSARTEAGLLLDHLSYWRTVLAELAPGAAPRVEFSVFGEPALTERLRDMVLPALAGQELAVQVPVVEDPDRQRARGYYTGGALRLVMHDDGRELELGDGGFTDWTAQLLNDAKERCLVSCVSIDRIAKLGSA